MPAKLPEVSCSYVAPDQCSDTAQPTCCKRDISAVEDAGVVLGASVALLLTLSLLAAIVG